MGWVALNFFKKEFIMKNKIKEFKTWKMNKKFLNKFSSREYVIANKELIIVAPKIRFVSDNIIYETTKELKNLTYETRH